MTFQPISSATQTAPERYRGAVVSLCIILATAAALLAISATGIGLIEW